MVHSQPTTTVEVRTLTLEQDPASIVPEALVKYFPAEHWVHAAALEPEYWPVGHCKNSWKPNLHN